MPGRGTSQPGTRPRPAGKDARVQVRLPPEQLAALDAWIETRARKVSRAEAIRCLVMAKVRVDLDSGD